MGCTNSPRVKTTVVGTWWQVKFRVLMTMEHQQEQKEHAVLSEYYTHKRGTNFEQVASIGLARTIHAHTSLTTEDLLMRKVHHSPSGWGDLYLHNILKHTWKKRSMIKSHLMPIFRDLYQSLGYCERVQFKTKAKQSTSFTSRYSKIVKVVDLINLLRDHFILFVAHYL